MGREIGPATRIEVEVHEPVVKHTVTVLKLKRWTEASAVTPADRIGEDQIQVLLQSPPWISATTWMGDRLLPRTRSQEEPFWRMP